MFTTPTHYVGTWRRKLNYIFTGTCSRRIHIHIILYKWPTM